MDVLGWAFVMFVVILTLCVVAMLVALFRYPKE